MQIRRQVNSQVVVVVLIECCSCCLVLLPLNGMPVWQVNGVDFRGITHQQAVTVLKRCGSTADIVCQYQPEGIVIITIIKSVYTQHLRSKKSQSNKCVLAAF